MAENPEGREATLVGRRLGEFIVREELSRGGFGLVFRAEQPALAREAVIKVMHARLRARDTLIQRFLREARLASRLDHPYAAHIYAFGAEPDGVLWIAMELVRGTPLDKMLAARGPLALDRFAPLLERICEVVQTAHEQGIIHRDLKPGNVMVLARAGQLLPKLLDLGIAKLTDDDLATSGSSSSASRSIPIAGAADDADGGEDAFANTATPEPGSELATSGGRLTEEGAVMGSPLYMAPEQWTDAGTVDARTDIYALGILSYEALTGDPPFTGANRFQIALAHAQQSPKPLASSGYDFPPGLDEVIARALAKRPADRFASALELARAFKSASGIADDPVALPHISEERRAAVVARAPQPIAQAATLLESARNLHQARDAVWQLVRVAVRLVGVIALSAHAHVGSSPNPMSTSDVSATEAVRRLRSRALPDGDWLALAGELVRPFARLRDAYPIPELVDLFASDGVAPITELLALRDGSEGGATDDQVRALLEVAIPLVERMLANLAFLSEYRVVVPGEGGAQVWMGVRRTNAATTVLRGGRLLVEDQPALVDATGLPVVTLWPFVQLHEPARGVGPRLMFFEGKGRRGARMVALPETFEHEDEALWEVIGGLADDKGAAAPAQEVSPFPGLAAFTAEDASRFFGRERESEELVNRLRAQPLLAIVGPSGVGKSSFVQAGVVPNLPPDWEVVTLRPGATPLVSLTSRLAKLGIDPAALRSDLGEHPGALGTHLRARGKDKGTVLIVVDQLEELFTLCDDVAERTLFAEALVRAARSAEDPVRVVFTLRDDFLLHAEALPALRARLASTLHLLTTPGRDDLLRILTQPLRRAGYELDDPALAGEMVDSLAGARSALALLSFTASKLWDLRDRRFRQCTRKAYASLGGIGGALARHAEATLEAMLPDEQRLVRELFRHAVTAEGTRAVLLRTELDQLLNDRRHGPTVIEKLVAARLLVALEGPGGVEQIEITHEALVDAWPRLVTWRREDAEGVRLRDQLRQAARQWDERGRPLGLVWRGDALAEYRLWRSRYSGSLTDVETAFATASLDDAARAIRRRRAILAASFSVLAVGVVALLVLNSRVADQRAAAVDSAELAKRSEAEAKANAQKLHDNLLESYQAQARQYVLAGDYQRALTFLDEAKRLGARGPAFDLVTAFAASGLAGKLASFAHAEAVLQAQFSPDGTHLVTAGFDNRAKLWNLADPGAPVAELVHGGPVDTARFEPNGDVLTSSDDGTGALWDGATGKQLAVFDAHVPKTSLLAAIPSPDGQLVVTISQAHAVWLWDRAAKLRFTLQEGTHDETALQYTAPCAFSPDSGRVAVGDTTGTLRVWDTRTGKLVGAVVGHHAQINTVAFARDSVHVVTASNDRTASVWSVGEASVKQGVVVRHESEVNDAVFSPDGKSIATASDDHTARVWDAATGDRLMSLAGHVAGVNAVRFRPDGAQLATAADDATIVLWDTATGRIESRLVGHRASVNGGIDYDAKGERLVSASIDKTAIVWNTAPQQRATRIVGHVGRVFSVELSRDGTRVATGGEDHTARVWDRATGRQLISVTLPGPVDRATLSPDGTLLATAGSSGIGAWNATTGAAIATLPTAEIEDVEWSPDGATLLAAGDDNLVRVWAPRDNVVRTVLAGHTANVISASFSPTGDRVITTSRDRTTRLWRARTGEELQRWPGDLLGARFDPRGELLVAHDGLEAKVWRVDDTARATVGVMKHDGLVLDVRWSAHGDFIATASIDATIRIWDREGHLLAVLGDGHTQWWRVGFSSDDRFIVGGSSKGVVVWELPPPVTTFDRLVRCKVYELRGTELVVVQQPPDCT